MRSVIIKIVAAVFSGLCATLALFQLMPVNTLTGKLWLALIVVFLLSGLVILLMIKWAKPHVTISDKAVHRAAYVSLAAAAILVFTFHLSFPQKELVLPQTTIQISADGPLRFLSLNNGFRGISLSDYEKSEDWQRSDDELILSADQSSAWLKYQGQHTKTVEAFFIPGEKTAEIRVDWGDGIVDDYTLTPGTDTADHIRFTHEYQGTGLAEKINFGLNLLPVYTLLFWLLFAYFVLLSTLLSRRTKRFCRVFIILSLCTLFMRVYNAYDFPLGWDEGTYARASMQYTEKILSFKFGEIPNILYNHEHPAFVKVTYSLPGVMDGREYFARFDLNKWNGNDLKTEDYCIFTSRLIAAIFSLLTVQALAYLIHPLAGFFLMIDSYGEAYGAQTRLEAIPMLTSFLSVWFFSKYLALWKDGQGKKGIKMLMLSALTLGITAASKYIYCVIVVPMVIMAVADLIRKNISAPKLISAMLLMAVLSLLSFYIFNPSVWKHPIERVSMEFSFHGDYEQSHEEIYPWWYSIAWVTRSIAHQSGIYFDKTPLAREPQHFFFSCDELIFLLAVIGSVTLFKKRRIYVYWFITAMLFLTCWGTKWEQYTCITVIPVCIAAYYGLRQTAQWLSGFDKELPSQK